MKIGKKIKQMVLSGFVVVGMAFLGGCGLEIGAQRLSWENGWAEDKAQKEDSLVSVHFLKVGKADCIMIFAGWQTIVIDTAETDDGEKILDYLAAHGRERIDELILTHYDKDHIGGAKEVLSGIGVERIYAPDYPETKEEYQEYQKAVHREGIQEILVTNTIALDLGFVQLEIDPPKRVAPSQETNENSLVVSMYHGDNSFFFAGDAVGERSKELLLRKIGTYTVLKAPHHGREDPYNEALFAAIHPEITVITDSDKNPANNETLEILEELSCTVYETRNGTVVLESDGSQVYKIRDGSW